MDVGLGVGMMQGDGVEVDAVADADGALAEDLRLVGEGDEGLHLGGELPAEQPVDIKGQPVAQRIAPELLVVGVGGNLGHASYAGAVESPEQPDEHRAGIHEAAGIDQPDALLHTITVDAAEVDP